MCLGGSDVYWAGIKIMQIIYVDIMLFIYNKRYNVLYIFYFKLFVCFKVIFWMMGWICGNFIFQWCLFVLYFVYSIYN